MGRRKRLEGGGSQEELLTWDFDIKGGLSSAQHPLKAAGCLLGGGGGGCHKSIFGDKLPG